MDHLRFAFCIVFPDTSSLDVVNAAMRHNVHIIDKEKFDPKKDYTSYKHGYTLENGAEINPLFVFPADSILADNEHSFRKALQRLKDFQTNP